MSSLLDTGFITELQEGLQSESTDKLECIINKHGKDFLRHIIAFNQNERATPLTFAIGNSSTSCAIVKYLISADKSIVNLSIDPPFEWGALHCAATDDTRYEKAKLLVENGAKVNAADSQGNTPLHHACNYGSPKIARLLLRHSASPTIRNNKHESAHGIALDHQNPYVLASIIKGIQKHGERPTREQVHNNTMDISDMQKVMQDMRTSIDCLKRSDDVKYDQIRKLELQNQQLVVEVESFKQTQAMLVEKVKRIPELEAELSTVKTFVNELNSKLQSQEAEVKCLKAKLESFEKTELSKETMIHKNKKTVENLQEHQAKYGKAIWYNSSNIHKNELNIEFLIQFSQSLSIKVESVKRETTEIFHQNIQAIHPLRCRLVELESRVDEIQDAPHTVRSLDTKLEILEQSDQDQNIAIHDNTRMIKTILTTFHDESESKQTVDNPTCSVIPVPVEHYQDGGSTTSCLSTNSTGSPGRADNLNTTLPYTLVFQYESKDKADISKSNCSEGTIEQGKDNPMQYVDETLCHTNSTEQSKEHVFEPKLVFETLCVSGKQTEDCSLTETTLKSVVEKEDTGAADTRIKTVWRCDVTEPTRRAYDDTQLDLRSTVVNEEFQGSRRRRWTGETNRVRECVTMSGKRFVEDHRKFDVLEDFRDDTIRMNRCMKIRRVDPATLSQASLEPYCPPASPPASTQSSASSSASESSESSSCSGSRDGYRGAAHDGIPPARPGEEMEK